MPFLKKLLNGCIAKLFKNNVTIEQSNNSAIRRGFTLIELLVVISIIGILATFAIASFTSAQAKGRDSRRKSDLDAIKKSLELFKGDTTGAAFYPQTIPAPGSVGGAGQLVTAYIKAVPGDPSTGAAYTYTASGGTCTVGNNLVTNANCTGYTLRTCLENANDTQKDTTNTCTAPLVSYTVSNP